MEVAMTMNNSGFLWVTNIGCGRETDRFKLHFIVKHQGLAAGLVFAPL
jgi:hypothetical protein